LYRRKDTGKGNSLKERHSPQDKTPKRRGVTPLRTYIKGKDDRWWENESEQTASTAAWRKGERWSERDENDSATVP